MQTLLVPTVSYHHYFIYWLHDNNWAYFPVTCSEHSSCFVPCRKPSHQFPKKRKHIIVSSCFGCHHLRATTSNCNNKEPLPTIMKTNFVYVGSLEKRFCSHALDSHRHWPCPLRLKRGYLFPSSAMRRRGGGFIALTPPLGHWISHRLLSAYPHFQIGSCHLFNSVCFPQYEINIIQLPVIMVNFRAYRIPANFDCHNFHNSVVHRYMIFYSQSIDDGIPKTNHM